MATSTNARFPRPLVVSCNLGLIFVVLDIISVSHNNISLTKISTAFWEKGNNPTCRVDAVQIKQIAPWFHSVDPPSSSCKNHPSTAVIGWPHWVPSLCFLWQLTHTVALVMYIFLEVYFMSFSSADNADVFGLHIGLLLRHSCHSWLQECLWARRVEQTGIKDVGVCLLEQLQLPIRCITRYPPSIHSRGNLCNPRCVHETPPSFSGL